LAQSEKEYRDKEKGEWPEEEKFSLLAEYEDKFAPICYRMASVDAERAKRIALKLQNPSYRALCLGVIAEAVENSDKVQAKMLILQAYEILAEAMTNPRRAWWCWNSPPKIGGMLLPIVEKIDPTLVEECLWKAVSFRHDRPADDFILGLEPEYNDVHLANLLSRYDRSLAEAMFPLANATTTPPINDFWSSKSTIIVLTEPERILFSFDKDSQFYIYEIQTMVETLLREPSHRWDELTTPYK
jgi:hypothetical protein